MTVDLALLRASQMLESDPLQVTRIAAQILQEVPGHTEASLLLATACRRLADPSAAAAVLEPLAAAHPHLALLQLELGRAYGAGGKSGAAAVALRRALELDGGLADAWRELAAQLFAAGETFGGDSAYAQYERLSSEPPGLKDAYAALADDRLDTVEKLLRQHLERMPGDVAALRLRAEVATRREDYALTQRCLTRCLELAPGFGQARYDLARLLHTLNRHAEVLAPVERLLALEPRRTDYLGLKAQTLRHLGRSIEAVALMERTVAEQPDQAQAWMLFGHLLREMGKREQAIGAYRRALEVRPDFASAYASLASLQNYRFTPLDLAQMRALLALPGTLGANRISLEFALGKALEDEQEFGDSFAHYARGNVLRRSTFAYDARATTADVERLTQLFTRRFFDERAGWGSAHDASIFIVGVPRSGSTLLEQMLASHTMVEGTRELTDLPAVLKDGLLQVAQDSEVGYAQAVGALRHSDAELWAAQYLARTLPHRTQGRPRFVDKLSENFVHIGLIHLLFPRAAILDARRHPLACGFSCYKQLLARNLKYASDLTEMGQYYRDYVRLMDHFDAVLPGRVYHVHYERLVQHPEQELRSILDYCRLPFEPQCLRFHENARIVQTISSEQVRQPLYVEGIDHWRNFEPWLGPLKAALGELLERHQGAIA